LNRGPPACIVSIPWLHRYFTGIHRVLPCQTVVRPARVWATSALLRDTPWPNRESPYLHCGHSSCRFYYGFTRGLTVERRIMPKSYGEAPKQADVFTHPGTSRRVLVVLNIFPPVEHVFFRFNACLPVLLRWCPGWPRCPHRDAPGLKTGTV